MQNKIISECLALATAFGSMVGQDVAQDSIQPLSNLNNIHVYDWQDLGKIAVSIGITIASRFLYAWIENYFKSKKQTKKTDEKN